MKHPLSTLLFILIGLSVSSQNNASLEITPKLKLPFGTIVKLQVEIYDGDILKMKDYQGTYLLKLASINDTPIKDTLLFTFVDESEKLANDNFSLFKMMYGKTAKSITNSQIDRMKKSYVHKKFTVMAYETGQFMGVPNDYFKYKPIRADTDFHFKHQLIVLSVVSN